MTGYNPEAATAAAVADIRAYIATLDMPEVLGYLPCLLNSTVSSALAVVNHPEWTPAVRGAFRQNLAFSGITLVALKDRLNAVLDETHGVTPDHANCDAFMQMMNAALMKSAGMLGDQVPPDSTGGQT